MNLSCEANVDKKRKAVSQEPELGSNQHSSSTTLLHPALILGQINSGSKESEVSQAKITPLFPHEVCIDGWTIPYKEFQPQNIKRARKRSSQTKMNFQSQQADNTLSNNSVEYDITKNTAKIMCYRCQQEGHYANFFHGIINNYTMEVARVISLLDYHQKVSVIPNLKEAFGESDE